MTLTNADGTEEVVEHQATENSVVDCPPVEDVKYYTSNFTYDSDIN